MEGYRIPEESEFVQGFEFEYLDIQFYGFCILDIESGHNVQTTKMKEFKEWIPTKVNWKHKPDDIIKSIIHDKEGREYTIWSSGTFENFLNKGRFNIPQLLKEGRIRVKLKQSKTMGKLNLVVEDVPKHTRAIKNVDLYQEIVEAFQALPLNKSFVISNDDLPATTVEVKLREMITVAEGERLKISRIKGQDGKLTGVRISKVAAPKPKKPTEPQGEAQTA